MISRVERYASVLGSFSLPKCVLRNSALTNELTIQPAYTELIKCQKRTLAVFAEEFHSKSI